jgi:Glycosyl hydrolase catalytic core
MPYRCMVVSKMVVRGRARAILPVVALVPLLVACSQASAEDPSTDSGPAMSSSGGSSGGTPEGGEDTGTSSAVDAAISTLPEGGASDATATAVGDAREASADASRSNDASSVYAGGDARAATADLYKGLANAACNDLVTLGASWYFNWTPSPGTCKASTFVPMVWGHTGSEQTATGIAGEVKGLVRAGYDTVLGFNEPDNTGQSNLTVATAIALWPSFTGASVRVGSPATQGNSTGIAWISSFMSQVNADTTGTLRVDFIAFHWYGWNSGSCDARAANLEAYLGQIEAIPGNRPIWLTEWGCLNMSNPDAATVQAFYSGALTMLAKHPRVERYAWYQWTTNNELVTTTDTLTSLGTVFAAAPAAR